MPPRIAAMTTASGDGPAWMTGDEAARDYPGDAINRFVSRTDRLSRAGQPEAPQYARPLWETER
jgi:hypothetical protein